MVSRLKDDLDKETLTRLQSAVTSLGADFLSGARFNSACTHLVCVKPYHTEKFIAACCAGKRVLHVNYIFDSLEAGMFLEVSNHPVHPQAHLQPILFHDWDLKTKKSRS